MVHIYPDLYHSVQVVMMHFNEVILENNAFLKKYSDPIFQFLRDLKSVTQHTTVKSILANLYVKKSLGDEAVLLYREVLNDEVNLKSEKNLGEILKSMAIALNQRTENTEQANLINELYQLFFKLRVDLDEVSTHSFCREYHTAREKGYEWIANLFLKLGKLIIDQKDDIIGIDLAEHQRHLVKLNFFKDEYVKLSGHPVDVDSDDEKSTPSQSPLISILPVSLFKGRSQSAPAELYLETRRVSSGNV
jgi:hypothetical protein